MFSVKKWDIDRQSNTVKFYFECLEYGDFCEEITFPDNVQLTQDETLERLLDVAAAYLGVSYYKLAASAQIHFDKPLSKSARQSIEKLYIDGLGEFYIRNELPYPPPVSFHYAAKNTHKSHAENEEGLRDTSVSTATIAFGGGKDSHVSMSLLDQLNIKQDIVSVVLSNRVRETLQKLSHKELTFIRRKVDPKLIKLVKERKGYNGHIPITAINSIILSIYSYLVGHNWVVFSNERGASIPTMHHGTHEINHQYSKSYEFETLFRNTLNDICGRKVQYFSLLRPFSELWIAHYLAKEALPSHPYFSSCNKNFIFEGEGKLPADQRWCGKCSKCVYTSIILAPHLSSKKFISIFGAHILDDPDNLQTAKNLCGIGDKKPWECVGDFADTASALFHLAMNDEWERNFIPLTLKSELKEKYGKDHLKERMESEISSRSDHFLPDQLLEIL